MAAAAVGQIQMGIAVLPVLLVITTIIVVVSIGEVYLRVGKQHRRQDEQHNLDYRQIKALISLVGILKPILPLPHMRGWAASPDILKKIAELILLEKPKVVVEASSGVSTLVEKYCLKKLEKKFITRT